MVKLTGPSEEAEWTMFDARNRFTLELVCTGVLLSFVAQTNISAALAYKPFTQAFALADVGRGAFNSAFFWWPRAGGPPVAERATQPEFPTR